MHLIAPIIAANMRDLLNNKITAVLVLDTLEPSG